MAELPWYTDPKFARYWKHYESVHNWFRCHMQAANMRQYNNLHQEIRWNELMQTYQSQMTWWQHVFAGCNRSPFYDRDNYFQSDTSVVPEDEDMGDVVCPSTVKNTYTCSSHSPPTKSHHKRGKRHKKLSKKRKRESLRSNEEIRPLMVELQSAEEDDRVEYEMEITEEMLEFFAKSAKYKVERGTL